MGGQKEVERGQARMRAERLDTSQHGKKETRLTGLGTLIKKIIIAIRVGIEDGEAWEDGAWTPCDVN